MTKQQIEAWGLRIIEQVKQHQPHEDAFVELKAEWPADKYKTARQIAGHANAAFGESILWLIGVDEKAGPTGCEPANLANWLAEIKSHFVELSPDIKDLNIPVDGHVVVALLIETDRAPYVVKNPTHGQKNAGPIASEVPWRDGTQTRTATRSNLISILYPTTKLPNVELLWATLVLDERNNEPASSVNAWRLTIAAEIYISPHTIDTVIPFHKTKINLALADCNKSLSCQFRFETESQSQTTQATTAELIVKGPGQARIIAFINTRPLGFTIDSVQNIAISFKPVGSDLSVTLPISLLFDANNVEHNNGTMTAKNRWVSNNLIVTS